MENIDLSLEYKILTKALERYDGIVNKKEFTINTEYDIQAIRRRIHDIEEIFLKPYRIFDNGEDIAID